MKLMLEQMKILLRMPHLSQISKSKLIFNVWKFYQRQKGQADKHKIEKNYMETAELKLTILEIRDSLKGPKT